MNCNQCAHRVKSKSTRYVFPYMCMNKKSKKYFNELWDGHPKCDCFEFNTKGATNG